MRISGKLSIKTPSLRSPTSPSPEATAIELKYRATAASFLNLTSGSNHIELYPHLADSGSIEHLGQVNIFTDERTEEFDLLNYIATKLLVDGAQVIGYGITPKLPPHFHPGIPSSSSAADVAHDEAFKAELRLSISALETSAAAVVAPLLTSIKASLGKKNLAIPLRLRDNLSCLEYVHSALCHRSFFSILTEVTSALTELLLAEDSKLSLDMKILQGHGAESYDKIISRLLRDLHHCRTEYMQLLERLSNRRYYTRSSPLFSTIVNAAKSWSMNSTMELLGLNNTNLFDKPFILMKCYQEAFLLSSLNTASTDITSIIRLDMMREHSARWSHGLSFTEHYRKSFYQQQEALARLSDKGHSGVARISYHGEHFSDFVNHALNAHNWVPTILTPSKLKLLSSASNGEELGKNIEKLQFGQSYIGRLNKMLKQFDSTIQCEASKVSGKLQISFTRDGRAVSQDAISTEDSSLIALIASILRARFVLNYNKADVPVTLLWDMPELHLKTSTFSKLWEIANQQLASQGAQIFLRTNSYLVHPWPELEDCTHFFMIDRSSGAAKVRSTSVDEESIVATGLLGEEVVFASELVGEISLLGSVSLTASTLSAAASGGGCAGGAGGGGARSKG